MRSNKSNFAVIYSDGYAANLKATHWLESLQELHREFASAGSTSRTAQKLFMNGDEVISIGAGPIAYRFIEERSKQIGKAIAEYDAVIKPEWAQ
jgi:hypothetical protein